MGAYDNPTYYGIVQDYTAFNKAMTGAFDKYMQLYLADKKAKQQKQQDPDDEYKKEYWKAYRGVKKIPQNFNNIFQEVYGTQARQIMPTADDDMKDIMRQEVVAASNDFQSIIDYKTNADMYLETPIEFSNILNGLGTTTKIERRASQGGLDKIVLVNKEYGEFSMEDIGNMLTLTKRDITNEKEGENFYKNYLNNIVDKVNSDQKISGKNFGESDIINGKYADNYLPDTIGSQNYAGYWHNNMTGGDKIVKLNDGEIDAWNKIVDKTPLDSKTKALLKNGTIDLSKFGFNMIDFVGLEQMDEDDPNKFIFQLRDRAIKEHFKKRVIKDAFAQKDAYIPSQDAKKLTKADQDKILYDDLVLNIESKYNDYENYASSPSRAPGPLQIGAEGYYEFLKANRKFNKGKTKDEFGVNQFSIQENIFSKFIPSSTGEEKARDAIEAQVLKKYGTDDITKLNQADQQQAQTEIDQKMRTYKNAYKTNTVFNIDSGIALNLIDFKQEITSDIYNAQKNNKDGLVDPTFTNSGLPIINTP